VLLLIAHHDAVPGSPGANDNAARRGRLIDAAGAALRVAPPTLRVRLLFTAAEERGYLGARQYVGEANLAELAGVLSLELCGIGDSVAVWDVADETPFLGQVRAALEGIRTQARRELQRRRTHPDVRERPPRVRNRGPYRRTG